MRIDTDQTRFESTRSYEIEPRYGHARIVTRPTRTVSLQESRQFITTDDSTSSCASGSRRCICRRDWIACGRARNNETTQQHACHTEEGARNDFRFG